MNLLKNKLSKPTIHIIPMSNNQLPADVHKRIEQDAFKKYPLILSHTHTDGPRTGYIAGATAEAERAQNVIAAFEALLNVMPNGDALRYFYAKEEIIKGRQAIEQWKEGNEIVNPCPHCGKELNRDRNLCCRECGKEVENE